MSISTKLNDLLYTMDYPAHKSDLVREAIREGVERAELDRLARMMPRNYAGRYDVLRELKQQRSSRSLWVQVPEAAPQ